MTLATGAVTQRTNVKPPLEFRLPKFAPVATRSASARAGPDNKIVATQRDTSTTPAKETVWEVVTGPTRPVGEPASGGSVQPDATGYCTCRSIDAEIAPRTDLSMERGGAELRVHFEWTFSCTRGEAGCTGTIFIVAPREFRFPRLGGFPFTCNSRCATETSEPRQTVMTSGNPNAGRGGVLLQLRFTCENRTTRKYYQLFFKQTGFVDTERSDLNGNRVPDGKEK